MVLSELPGKVAKGSENWFCGKTMFRVLSKAVSLAYSIAKAIFWSCLSRG